MIEIKVNKTLVTRLSKIRLMISIAKRKKVRSQASPLWKFKNLRKSSVSKDLRIWRRAGTEFSDEDSHNHLRADRRP